MVPEIQAVQKDIEGNFIALQPTVEKTALALEKKDQKLLTRYLTDYSIENAEMVVSRWKELGEHLITKYNDGYVQDETGEPEEKGYPENWLREVLKSKPYQFRLKPKQADMPEWNSKD